MTMSPPVAMSAVVTLGRDVGSADGPSFWHRACQQCCQSPPSISLQNAARWRARCVAPPAPPPRHMVQGAVPPLPALQLLSDGFPFIIIQWRPFVEGPGRPPAVPPSAIRCRAGNGNHYCQGISLFVEITRCRQCYIEICHTLMHLAVHKDFLIV